MGAKGVGAAPRRATSAGTVAGFVLRIARESIPGPRDTQVGFAEGIGVDLGTVQGWESGRRPLANMKAGSLVDLRRRLTAFGADPVVLKLIDAAMDADRIIGATLAPDGMSCHPLSEWVHTRDTAHMIAWALNGTTPPSLAHRVTRRRRGPVATAPILSAQERGLFFTRLRQAAEAAARAGESGALLHRQALYLSSYDHAPEATLWTASALHARRDLVAARGWTPHWAAARSTATALVRLGDPQPLTDFIERGMAEDDTAEAANLNYLGYWFGATPEPQADDSFMRSRSASWEPVRLMRCLTDGLDQAPGYVDLYIHSVWALLRAHKWLPLASSELAERLDSRTEQLLGNAQISPRSRRELGTVHYVLRETRT